MRNMKHLYLILFMTFETQAVEIDVEGEVLIKLLEPQNIQPRAFDTNSRSSELGPEMRGMSVDDLVVRTKKYDNRTVTDGPAAACQDRFPEGHHVHTLLSNMMNELTKFFVRASEMVNKALESRRGGETRFRVVSKKNTDFFENIYSTMTKQYLSFYKSAAVWVDSERNKTNPCENQNDMKELWKDLIEKSVVIYRRAAFQCIEEQLRAQGVDPGSKGRARLEQDVTRELSDFKMSQLHVLCDRFQLCYNELIRRADKARV